VSIPFLRTRFSKGPSFCHGSFFQPHMRITSSFENS
jgi:hypothetical protein